MRDIHFPGNNKYAIYLITNLYIPVYIIKARKMKQNRSRLVETCICLYAHELEGQASRVPGISHVRSILNVLMPSAFVCWCPKICILNSNLFQRRASCAKRRQRTTESNHQYFFMEDFVLTISQKVTLYKLHIRLPVGVSDVMSFRMHRVFIITSYMVLLKKNTGLDQDLLFTDNLQSFQSK